MKLFNITFFKFTLGFISIIAVSFVIMFITAGFFNNTNTSTAVEATVDTNSNDNR